MAQNANGQAATAIAPDHGPNIPQQETKMNTTEHSTEAETAPALITIPELQKEFEGIWADLHDLQRKAYLLMGRIDNDLDMKRAGCIDGANVTLLFSRRGIDVTDWLASQVWADTADLLEKADKLYDRIEALS